jgi:hypothetical protein
MVAPLHFTHLVAIIPGDFFLKYPKSSLGILDRYGFCQMLTLSEAYVLSELTNTSLVVKHERHLARPITAVVAPADMLLHLFALES